MKRRTQALHAWDFVHRWSSLICTVFMVLLCLTGLPLIFHHEIDHALGVEIEAPGVADDRARVDLDAMLATARARHPDMKPLFASQEADDDRIWYVTLSTQEGRLAQVAVDARDGRVLGEPVIGGKGVMSVIRSLHVDLFAGMPGKLFLGAMGVLLLMSIGSGVVLYAPFMRKLAFGTVRRDRAPRVRWLDLHNLIGIVTLTWTLVVGATGVVNTWAELLVQHWKSTELAAMTHAYRDRAAVTGSTSLQRATDAALAGQAGLRIAFIAFPGSSFSTPHHYGYFLRGDTSLTSQLLQPVLVDALTARVADRRSMPWYLVALRLSQPLHFGDYGGLPLKIVWALLDIATLIVLASGAYLWIVKGKRSASSSAPSFASSSSSTIRGAPP